MEPQIPRRWVWREAFMLSFGLLALLSQGLNASPSQLISLEPRASEPSVSFSEFTGVPKKLFYFEGSDTILLLESGRDKIHTSDDEGKTWNIVKDVEDIKVVVLHPFDKGSRAFAMTSGTSHYWTKDKGKSWSKFTTEYPPNLDDKGGLEFHAEELDWIIFKGSKCKKEKTWLDLCTDEAFYTKNSFSSSTALLSTVGDCIWGRSSQSFSSFPKELILCTEWPNGEDGIIRNPDNVKLVRTTEYFKKGSKETVSINGGVLGLGAVNKFIVAVIKSKKSADDIDLFVSTDGSTFYESLLPGDFAIKNDEAFTILESTDYRLTVDVLQGSISKTASRYGNLFFSNSNGTQFTHSLAYTNRNLAGKVDFERIQTSHFSGIIFANVVSNWKDLERGKYEEKRIASKLSFDDGAHWSFLRPPAKDADGNDWHCKVSGSSVSEDCALHLHSVTTFPNVGRVFSSNAAPGLIIGVGSVGKELTSYDTCHTFLSTDAGRNWVNIAKGPHKYETADMGGAVVLVPDNGPTNYILYSSKRTDPSSYKKLEITPKGVSKWKARLTDIDPDSTSNKMIIFLTDAENPNKNFIAHVDLGPTQTRKCESKDFEEWTPMDDGKVVCIMGEQLTYKRRQKDVECSVEKKFKHPDISSKVCECTELDFECDFNFRPGNVEADAKRTCEPIGPSLDEPENCKKGQKYQGSSGFRKIPGNKCEKGKALDQKVERECKEDSVKKSKPKLASKVFDDLVERFLYMRKSTTVFFVTMAGTVWRSDDEGLSWSEPDSLHDTKPIKLVGFHDTDDKRLYFFNENDIFYSADGSTSKSSLNKLDTPVPYNFLQALILDFHPTEKDYLVFVGGGRGCPDPSKCFTEVYLTLDHGKSWLNDKKPVETWATKCVWAHDFGFGEKTSLAKDAVYCSSYKYKNGKIGQDAMGGRGTDDNPLQLVLITNGGKDRRVLIDKGVVTFYVVDSFLTVAVESSNDVKILVSIDGSNFAEATFPPNMKVEKNGFTVLDSNTGSIFMDAIENVHYNREVGSLFKSNSNGTFFSRILENSNRNEKGQVDFEKVSGVSGVVLANQVSNPGDMGRAEKKIRSLASFDDGARWKRLAAPKKDSKGTSYSCDDCSLNLYRRTTHGGTSIGRASVATSPAAAGLIVGAGSVGSYLRKFDETDMFLSLDAGRTWREVYKGPHKWAIGDHGGVIVMASEKGPVEKILYSYNYGTTWQEFTISTEPILVHSILTVPDSTSLKFTILGITESKKNELGMTAFTLDFTDTLPRVCDKASSKSSDFESWSPVDEKDGSRCFLGKDIMFLRRKEDANCLIGKEFEEFSEDVKTCECTHSDFECDYNFWFDLESKECVLIGSDPMQPADCKNGAKYQGSSGYRKIPLSSCKGGKDLEKKVERTCGEASKGPTEVKTSSFKFKEKLEDYFFFNRTKVAVILDGSNRVWVSKDAGKTWETPEKLKDVKVVRMYLDPFRGSRAFLFTTDKKHFRLDDNGNQVNDFDAPAAPNISGAELFSIHPDNEGHLLYTGSADCDSSENCHAVTYLSTNNGASWSEIQKYGQKCVWGRDMHFKPLKDEIFCRKYEVTSGNQRNLERKLRPALFVSKDFGKSWEKKFDETIGFAISYEYMVAAVADKAKSGDLSVMVTTDGVQWNDAKFHHGESSGSLETAYTLLESGSGAIYLQAFISRDKDQEYGHLYKSNAAGTDFEIVMKNVNQDKDGYVDFEKMLGINSIAIVNEVANPDDISTSRSKDIHSLITFNDGARWVPLSAPDRDRNGNSFDCDGLMVGIGNVGKRLSKYNEGDVFITKDAGKTWRHVEKDAHMIEIGDRGGVILMVYDEGPTDEIKYTLDHGISVRSMKIADSLDGGKMRVTNIISEPYGSTSSFIVFGTLKGGNSEGKTVAVYLDFANVWDKTCKFDEKDADGSDFEVWSPSSQDSGSDGCIFGEQFTYYRRKSSHVCKIDEIQETPQKVNKACECTVDDYECDTGFFKNSTGGCSWTDKSVPIPEPVCINGIKTHPSGFRRHKKTKCQGGVNLTGKTESCVGIPAAVSYAIVWNRRGGRIRLPVDSEAPPPPKHLADRVGQALRVVLVIGTEAAEFVISKSRLVYDWVRMRMNRTAGYTPVRNVATALDDEIDNDPALMDLDDY
ncbi:vacuolar protein sorting/targeting protein PEP1 [Phlyctochytrium planicorne]|nr:vacuolar protein sorting/targeting protein PEP1 [Phlyctochytrium planicorne]